MAPKAYIASATSGRIRLRLEEMAGDHEYFEKTARAIESMGGVTKVEYNPTVGSLLICGEPSGLSKLPRLLSKKRLLTLTAESKVSVQEQFRTAFGRADELLTRWSDEFVDLGSAFTLVLTCLGIIELIRGGGKAIPWYTAFWYASGIYARNKSANNKGG